MTDIQGELPKPFRHQTMGQPCAITITRGNAEVGWNSVEVTINSDLGGQSITLHLQLNHVEAYKIGQAFQTMADSIQPNPSSGVLL